MKLLLFAVFCLFVLAAGASAAAAQSSGERRAVKNSLEMAAADPAVTPTPTSPAPLEAPALTLEPTTVPAAGQLLTSTLVLSNVLPAVNLASLPVFTSSQAISHVVVISIDGLRPDAIDLADAPTLQGLKARGTFSPYAQTVCNSETLPSHAAMVSGMVPEKNGILWGLPYIGWPGMTGPSMFSAAHDAGLSTGMVFGKEKLSYLILPNSVDKVFGADVHDPEIRDRALEMIGTGLPNVLFIHFPDTDRVGHAYGWLSQNQLWSVSFVDGLVKEILAALDYNGYLANILLIITSDHGGHDKVHGNDSPEDRTIPWLAVGPGVPAGIVLYRQINTYDTAATVLYALNVPVPATWDGKPVMEIFSPEPAAVPAPLLLNVPVEAVPVP